MASFEFDGAEGIAFWVDEGDDGRAARVMLEDLPALVLFLRNTFVGLGLDPEAIPAAPNSPEVVAELAHQWRAVYADGREPGEPLTQAEVGHLMPSATALGIVGWQIRGAKFSPWRDQ